MTVNDPIQGILVRKPETLFFVNRATPLTKSQNPRTDRLQGIVFRQDRRGPRVGTAKLTDFKILPNLTPERIREIDNLTVTELEELTAGMVLATQKQKAGVIRSSRHSLIHSIHLPLRSRGN